MINWHETHEEENNDFGDISADNIAKNMGSWKFIIIQTIIVAIWMILNLIGWKYEWDIYPFILLNLVFSIQAAYSGPIIMMSQNRQSDRDRHHAEADFQINLSSKQEIESIQKELARVELEKLDKLIDMINEIKTKGIPAVYN